MTCLILGSGSPRRREIISYYSLPFRQEASDFDEESVPYEGNCEEYALKLSYAKATALRAKHPDGLILTADTIVVADGRLYGKPKDDDEAFQFLSELQGRWHSVYTAVTLMKGSVYFQDIEETKVLFNPLSKEEILHYQNKIHWKDKAGGYAIQMAGGLLVKRIEGCYYNVMGLPINTLRKLLLKFDIELWDYLKG